MGKAGGNLGWHRLLALGATAASMSLIGYAASPVMVAMAAAPPSCSFAFWDDAADAKDNSNPSNLTPPAQPNLDIIEGDFGVTPDGKSLRAVFTIQNQNWSFSQSEQGIDYQMVFAFGSTGGNPNLWATDASMNPNPQDANNPIKNFSFGVFQGVSAPTVGQLVTQYVPIANSGATGQIGGGLGGRVEVDVPLSSITTGGSPAPKIGDTLTQVQGYSASGQGVQSQGNEFISETDPSASTGSPTGTYGNNYKIGQATCVDAGFNPPVIPEAPLAAAIPLVGAAALVAFERRRRRPSSRT